jgi:NhaP-type Na+/H+ and K+/H+ antiporters
MATDGTLLAAAADSAVTVGGLFELLGLVVVVAAVAALSRRVPVAGPILCVLVGVALSYVPGVPDYRIDPNVVLLLFLPPLLYSAAWRTSNRSLRANLRPIALLSVGLVLFTTLVVGWWPGRWSPVCRWPRRSRSARSSPRPTPWRRRRWPAAPACPGGWSASSRARAW